MGDEIYFKPPNRHWELKKCSFENFEPSSSSQTDALRFLEEFNVDSPVGLYLHGPAGRGKSHLLVAVARHFTESKVQVSYCDGITLWSNIRQHVVDYNPDNSIVRADIVIVDDIDFPYKDQVCSNLFYRLVLDLYDQGKPVIFSSNKPPDGLVEKLIVAKNRKAVSTGLGVEVLTELGSDQVMQNRISDRFSEMFLIIDLSDAAAYRENLQKRYAIEHRTSK